jgi:hypothetical protein
MNVLAIEICLRIENKLSIKSTGLIAGEIENQLLAQLANLKPTMIDDILCVAFIEYE